MDTMTPRQLATILERLSDPPPQPQPARKLVPCPRCGRPNAVAPGSSLDCDECMDRDFLRDLDMGD